MKRTYKKLEDWQVEDAARLRDIFNNREIKLSQEQFASDFDLGSQSMISQYLAGYRPLNIKAAVSFARGMLIDIRDFSPTLADQIADAAKLHKQDASIKMAMQWITPDEDDLLQHYRRTDDDGRKAIMRTAKIMPNSTAFNELTNKRQA
jgi:transcriptional regulator with XRE-family HTH domain